MTVVHADAVVIGAGAGGLCAAARLAHAGLHTLVVDDNDRIGGRASTEQIDGFTVNIGAIAIELGGVFEETFNTVGAPLDIRTPEPASSFFIDGKLIDVGRGGWSLLLGQLTKQASRILEKFADARSGNLPDGRQSTEDWLKTYTSNASVHAIFRNLCAAIFACNAAELRSLIVTAKENGVFFTIVAGAPVRLGRLPRRCRPDGRDGDSPCADATRPDAKFFIYSERQREFYEIAFSAIKIPQKRPRRTLLRSQLRDEVQYRVKTVYSVLPLSWRAGPLASRPRGCWAGCTTRSSTGGTSSPRWRSSPSMRVCRCTTG